MKRIALFVVLASLAAPAFSADSGFYSGTSIGRTSVSNPTAFPLTKSSDFVFGGFIGYRLNRFIGFEGAYTGTGKYRNATQSGKSDALSVDAVAFVPIGSRVELFGKLGVADSFGKSSSPGLSNANRIAPTYGAGVQFNVSDSTGIRLGVDRFSGAIRQGAVTDHYDSNVFGATFVYRF